MSLVHISGRIAPSPVAWVSSGRHIVIPFGRVLHVFDITESKPKCVAYLRGHTATVVSVVTAGNMRVSSASEDGTVRFWDVDDGSCLRTIDVGQRLYQMCSTGEESYVCLGVKRVFQLAPTKKGKSRLQTLFSDREIDGTEGGIASSVDGAIVAAIDKHVLLLTSSSKHFRPVVAVRHYSWLTAVAVSNDGSMVAVGDEKGSIFVYPNPTAFMPQSNKTVRLSRSQIVSSTLHWHSSPVEALDFSSDANFLLSGGSEAAVVTWKMAKNRFGERSVLPRLKSSIHSISLCADDSTYALVQGDNSVRLIDASSNSLSGVIRGVAAAGCVGSVRCRDTRGISSDSQRLRVRRYPLKDNWVVVSGSGCDIHLFDTQTGLHVSDHTIVPRNFISEPGMGKGSGVKGSVQVSAVEFSQCGTKMATVDTHCLSHNTSGEFGIEEHVTSLRFWDVKHEDTSFNLSAVFAQPHGRSAKIEDICFHPHLAVAATASSNGSFRLWREVRRGKKGLQLSWRSEAELSYKKQLCNSLCFSSDGSLLGVACGSALTIWSVDDLLESYKEEDNESDVLHPEFSSPSSLKLTFLHALVHPPTEEKILSVSFLQRDVPMFVTATDSGLYVWNALTQGVWWSTRMRLLPRTLSVDAASGRFAIAVEIPATFDAQTSNANVNKDQHDTENQGDKEPKTSKVGLEALEPTTNTPNRDIRGNANRSTVKKRPRSDQKETQAPEHPTSARRNRPASDCAMAMFEAQSPVPTRICRLDTGVTIKALEFVHRRSGSESIPTLVCVDSGLEVSMLDENKTDAEPSISTSPSLNLGAEMERGDVKSKSILRTNGGSQLITTSPAEHESSNEPESVLPQYEPDEDNVDIKTAFRNYFEGPIHAQEPISSRAFEFIKQLLPGSEQGNKEDGVDNMDDGSADHVKHVEPDEQEAEGKRNGRKSQTMADYEACRVFCANLVKLHFRDRSIAN